MIGWYIGSDNLVTLTGLYDQLGAAYVNDADSIIGKFFAYTDSGESAQIGSDITFSYVTASDGNYQGVLPNNTAMTQGTMYYLKITITEGEYILIQKLMGRAQYRGDT